jgi:hypothetical protein
MRAWIVVGLGLAFAIAVSSAWGSLADSVVEAKACGSGYAYTYLFWPHGHAAIPSLKFPAYPAPNVQLYAGFDRRYGARAFRAFVTARGGSFTRACEPTTIGEVRPLTGAPPLETDARLVCRFPRAPVHELVQLSGGGYALVTVVPPAREVVYAIVRARDSKLVYDGSLCRALTAPT